MSKLFLNKAILVIFIFIFGIFQTNAQCPSGNISLLSQATIDNFIIQYPNCTEILGNLNISAPGATNLDGLRNLQSIKGQLNITHNPNLTNLNGLKNIENIFRLWISNNAVLSSINAFISLDKVEETMYIGFNPQLKQIGLFNNLKQCEYLNIDGNEQLESIGGFSALSDLFNFEIKNNTKLLSVSSFSVLQRINGNFIVEGNALLPNIAGLNNLSSVGKNINIRNNIALTHLNGLSNLTSIGGRLHIQGNTVLNDISGLQNINPGSISENGLIIQNNPALAVCHLPNFCTYLVGSGPRNISGNLSNCLNEQAIINACCILDPPQNIFTTNANNCQANNGSVIFSITASCSIPVYYSLNGANWTLTSHISTVTISDLTPKSYLLYIAKQGSHGLPDFQSIKYGFFTIGINTPGSGSILITCAPDITLPFSTTNYSDFVLPQFYGACGVTNTKISKYEVIRPDGTSTVIDPFDPSIRHGLTPRQEGNYQIKWTITGQNGNNNLTKTCTQIITSKKNANAVFKSQSCNTTSIKVSSCTSGTTIVQLNVSGLNVLNSEYGLKSVKINANFPTKFNGIINLISPNGSKWSLTQGTDFPQFDGSKQPFNVNFTSCYALSAPHSSANIPFVPYDTYRAKEDLQGINYFSINPNGVWGLEVCASTSATWDLNCFELEFGKLCPELIDYTIVGACSANDKGSISVSLSQIKGSYCDDLDLDGTQNYRMLIDNIGEVTLQPNQQSLNLEAIPGNYTLKFGRYFLNNNGQLAWHCYKDYTIDIPIVDNQKPLILNCPTNTSVTQVANGTTTFITLHPTVVTDNCGIDTTGLNIRYLNGTNNTMGLVSEKARFTPGSNHTINIMGSGKVEFEYWATDHANNTQICKYELTVVGDPCYNDKVRPTYTNCPSSQLLVLNNDDYAQIKITDPFLSDNCKVIKESLELNFLGGTHDNNNDKYKVYNNALVAGNTFSYDVNKEGLVIFKYTAEDAAGNKGYCFSYITTVKNVATCSNDTQAPKLDNCPKDLTIKLDNNDSAFVDLMDPDIYENCLIDSKSLTINCQNGANIENGKTNIVYKDFYPGQEFRYTISGAGITNLIYSVTDASGNIGVCQTKITTIPQGDGVLFNLNPVCVAPGVKTYIPVTVNNFKKIGAFSFDLYFANNTGIQFFELENKGISNIQYNVLSNGNLRVSWDDPSGNDIDLDPNFKLFDIVVLSDDGYTQPTRLEGKDVVVLSSIINDGKVNGGEICISFLSHPKGTIKSPTNNGHANVEVELLSSLNKINKTTTNSTGNYTFDKTSIINKVSPYKNDEWRRGVDIVDVARIRRHFLETLPLDNKYKILAADVNKDGKINVLDVAYTNRLFLHKIQEFPNNTSWRFIPEYIGTDFDPLNVNITEFINLNDSNVDDLNLNFVSIKTGDVDHSALLKTVEMSETRGLLPLFIFIPDTIVAPGNNIRIPVYISGNDPISVMSLNIQYDKSVLELVRIESTLLPSFGEGNYNDVDGRILIGWDHPQSKSIDGNGSLMTLIFNTISNSGSSLLSLSDVNVYTKDFDRYNVRIADGSVSYSPSSTTENQNQSYMKVFPNPFTEQVDVFISLPKLQDYSVKVFDVNGRIFQTYTIKPESTKEHLKFNGFLENGVYFIKLQSESFNEVLKVIKI